MMGTMKVKSEIEGISFKISGETLPIPPIVGIVGQQEDLKLFLIVSPMEYCSKS